MLDYLQLEALLAVDETGTYEGAARDLNLSAFAVNQRIKTLEAKLGVELIERCPTRTTELAKVLCAHTRQVRNLEGEVIEQHRIDRLEDAKDGPDFKIAIVNESFTNWFLNVLADKQIPPERPRLDIQLTNQKHTNELMRSGDVVGALTHNAKNIYGFKTYELGAMNYRAVASPGFIKENFPEGITQVTLSKAPCLRANESDVGIHDWVELALGKSVHLPIYRHPSIHGTLKACIDGHVWAVLPETTIGSHLKTGELADLMKDTPLVRNLYWHVAGTVTILHTQRML